MRKTKFLSLLLAVVMLCTFAPLTIPAAEKEETQFFDELAFLKSAGVIEEDLGEKATVEKSLMAQMITKILYPDTDFSSIIGEQDLFADVKIDHPQYAYIRACKDLNIIRGDNQNNFYPDESVTMQTAITMLINALGYTPYAIHKGGFPTGYYQVARESGLTKGLDLSTSQPISGNIVGKLVYNALFTDLIEVTGVSQDEISITVNSGKNLLSEHLGIKEYDARIIDNGVTSIAGQGTLDSQRIVLSQMGTGVRFSAYVANSDIGDYLGSRVKVFIKNNRETARDEVIHYAIHKKSNEVVLKANKIINVTSSYVEYEKEKNSEKYEKLKLDSLKPIVVVNGAQLIDFNFSDLILQDGFVRAVDHDGNGSYEFLEIYDFEYENAPKYTVRNIIVDAVDEENGYINCKFNPILSLNLDPAEATYRIIRSGEIKTLSDILENDVVSVAEVPTPVNNKRFYYLMVARNSITGAVSSVDHGAKELTIQDETYQVSDSLLSVRTSFLKTIAFNQEMSFLLDACGKIAYTSFSGASVKNYAYLIDAKVINQGDKVIQAKLFTKDGEMRIFELANKVNIDGYHHTDVEQAFTQLKTRPAGSANVSSEYLSRPIIFELNGDERIIRIDTDTPNKVDEDSDEVALPSSETFIQYTNSEIEDPKALKAGFRNIRIGKVEQVKRTVEGRFYLTNDTMILGVPDIDLYGLDQYQKYLSNKYDSNQRQPIDPQMVKLYEASKEDHNYTIISPETLSPLFGYDIQAYDVDPDTGVAAFAVVRGRMDSYLYGAVPYTSAYPMFVFLKKAEVYDTELQKNITKLYFTKDGYGESSALVDTQDLLFSYKYIIEGCSVNDTPYKKDVPALKRGDIIRVIQEGGWLKHIERVFRIDEVTTKVFSSSMYPTNTRVMYSKTIYGMLAESMPMDQRAYFSGFFNNYSLGVGYAKQISGGRMQVLLGNNYPSDVDLSNPNSYIQQGIDIAGIPIVVIHIDKNGATKVRLGETSDIKTTQIQGGTTGSSLILYKQSSFRMEQIFVLNDER